MAITNNATFLTVTKPLPFEGSGYEVHILNYRDYTTLDAILTEFSALSISPALNDSGMGSITLDADSPFWKRAIGDNNISAVSIRDKEYVFEVWEDGVKRFAFLGQSVDENQVAEDGSRTITISGPGIGDVLKMACIMRPGWPRTPAVVGKDKTGAVIRRSTSSSDLVPAFLWKFTLTWPTMRMWGATLRAAQRRGIIPYVKPTFTAFKDSAGKSFQYVPTVSTVASREGYQPDNPSMTLFDWLNQCTGQDPSTYFAQRLEWMMLPGFRLDVRTQIGVDRSDTVRFFDAQVATRERVRDRQDIRNVITAVDVVGGESIVTSKTSVAAWQRREQRNDTNKNVTDKTLRGKLADAYLDQQSDQKSEWTVKIPYDQPNRRPFRNFNVGDWIGIVSYIGLNVSQVAKYRIMAMTIAVSTDSDTPDVELTLESVMDDRLKRLEKSITKLLNKPNKISLADLADVKAPADGTTTGGNVQYNPATNSYSVGTDYGGSSSSSGSGGRVFFQSSDPGTAAVTGDFWYNTTLYDSSS